LLIIYGGKKLSSLTKLVAAELTPLNEDFELTSFFFWNSLITELSKPCTLSLTNMHKNTDQRENKEVSRWMSHSKHKITCTSLLKKRLLKIVQRNSPLNAFLTL
jgi:hypothetical protein